MFTCLCFRETIFTHVGEYRCLHVYVSGRRSSHMSGSTDVYMFMFQGDDLHTCRGAQMFTCLCFRETIFTHVGEHRCLHVYVSGRRSSHMSGSTDVYMFMFQGDDLHSCRGAQMFTCLCFRETIFTHVGEHRCLHVYVSGRRSSLMSGSTDVYMFMFQGDDLHTCRGAQMFTCLCFRETIFTHVGEHRCLHVYVSGRRSSLMSGSTDVYMFMFQGDDLHSCRGAQMFTCLCFRETIFTHVGEHRCLHVYVSGRRSSLMSGSTDVYMFMFQGDDLHTCRGVRKFR